MAKSVCICQDKSSVNQDEIQHPTFTDIENALPIYQEKGYIVVRGLFSADEVAQARSEISSICSQWYANYLKTGQEDETSNEIANRRPAWKEGHWRPAPGQEELGFRKLFRMTLHNDFFVRKAKHEKIVPIVSRFLDSPDIKVLQSMCLLKPPGGVEKTWHQDNAYFRLTPDKVMGVWIALDPAYCANGCMHVLPHSHKDGVYKHDTNSHGHIEYGMVKQPNPDDVVSVAMEPGDALLFHCHLAHYTPPNVTDQRRRSLQYHYAASQCKPIKCPKGETNTAASNERSSRPQAEPTTDAPHYFDCDPACVEAPFFDFKKAEMLVAGRDLGGEYI